MDIDSTAPVVTRDEILIHAPLTEVWKAQTDISAWPQWRPEVPAARLDGELAVGSVFHWEEGGLRITSTVTEIVQPMPGREESITVQGPREFTGDVDLIFGHPAVVEARAGEDGEVLALRREALLALVQTDPGLSELLLRTFLQRRAFLSAHGKVTGSWWALVTRRTRCGSASSSRGTAARTPTSTSSPTRACRSCWSGLECGRRTCPP